MRHTRGLTDHQPSTHTAVAGGLGRGVAGTTGPVAYGAGCPSVIGLVAQSVTFLRQLGQPASIHWASSDLRQRTAPPIRMAGGALPVLTYRHQLRRDTPSIRAASAADTSSRRSSRSDVVIIRDSLLGLRQARVYRAERRPLGSVLGLAGALAADRIAFDPRRSGRDHTGPDRLRAIFTRCRSKSNSAAAELGQQTRGLLPLCQWMTRNVGHNPLR